jgi:hypothetical protein
MNMESDAEEKSLDLVQRWIISALLIVVLGGPAAALAAYSSHLAGIHDDSAVPLWVMSGVIGLLAAAGVLIVHRRSLVSPLLLAGLVPAAIAAFYIF